MRELSLQRAAAGGGRRLSADAGAVTLALESGGAVAATTPQGVTVPRPAFRVMQAYGSAAWLRVSYEGWNGGVHGCVGCFEQKLHESGFKFVRSGFTYYVRVESSLETLIEQIKKIASEIRAPNGQSHSRARFRMPLLSVREATPQRP